MKIVCPKKFGRRRFHHVDIWCNHRGDVDFESLLPTRISTGTILISHLWLHSSVARILIYEMPGKGVEKIFEATRSRISEVMIENRKFFDFENTPIPARYDILQSIVDSKYPKYPEELLALFREPDNAKRKLIPW